MSASSLHRESTDSLIRVRVYFSAGIMKPRQGFCISVEQNNSKQNSMKLNVSWDCDRLITG